MRTKILLQLAPGTDVPKLKSVRLLTSILCAIAMVLFAGCTSENKDHDSSTTAESAKKATADTSRSAPKAQTACELLTANEIAEILKRPRVIKDEPESRKNEFTKVDFCYWWPNGKVNPDRDERIELRLRRAETADEGSLMLLFSAAKGDAGGNHLQAPPLPGVGDEAIYSPYPDGGSIALRVGRSAVTISGLVSKDELVSMAKLVAQRL